jgi:hypothetical protein
MRIVRTTLLLIAVVCNAQDLKVGSSAWILRMRSDLRSYSTTPGEWIT